MFIIIFLRDHWCDHCCTRASSSSSYGSLCCVVGRAYVLALDELCFLRIVVCSTSLNPILRPPLAARWVVRRLTLNSPTCPLLAPPHRRGAATVHGDGGRVATIKNNFFITSNRARTKFHHYGCAPRDSVLLHLHSKHGGSAFGTKSISD
eukprot:m.90226 g.90226  ORF g.90226 m.90226 type:complete len:150 (-) comp20119_c0_seq5:2945-3394(-)